MKRNMKNKIGESGQAMTELIVSMIAILIVLTGFLLISALGIENIRGLLTARGEADRRAMSGVNFHDGKSIRDWNYGEDGLPFTKDDTAIDYEGGNYNSYLNELAVHDRETGEEKFNMQSDSSFGSVNYINSKNRFDLSNSNDFFIYAATLSSGVSRIDDPLEKRKLEGLNEVISNLFGIRHISLENIVFMPARANNESNNY